MRLADRGLKSAFTCDFNALWFETALKRLLTMRATTVRYVRQPAEQTVAIS
jgi:hypothetical protein